MAIAWTVANVNMFTLNTNLIMVNQGEDVVKSETGALKRHSALCLLVNILSEMIFPGYDNPWNHHFQYYLDVIVVYNISMRQSELDGEAGVGCERSPHQKVLKRFFSSKCSSKIVRYRPSLLKVLSTQKLI